MKLLRRKFSMAAAVFVAWMGVWTSSALQNAQAAAVSQQGTQPRTAASSDNSLSYLAFNAGTLSPAFTSTTQEYELTGLPYASSVGISYTTNSPLVYSVSAIPCLGNNPKRCDLTASNVTTVTVRIVAEDFSVRIYTVTVSRADGALAAPLVAPVAKLSHGATAEHKCAVLSNGKVLCWGRNDHGQLGVGTTSWEEFVPLTVTGVMDAVDVSVGLYQTCILRSGGGVQCWGRNDKGQLGDGTATPRTTPVDVLKPDGSGPLAGVTSVSVGEEFACALVDGAVLCWGRDAGLSGWDGSTDVLVTRTLPLTVTGLSDVVEIAAGYRHACARTNAGKVHCWGSNNQGQFGDGAAVSYPSVVAPATMKNSAGTADLTGVTALRSGREHTCVIVTTGHQLCAGYNGDLNLGDGTDSSSDLPVTTTLTGTAAALVNVAQSAPGDYHGCTLTANGTVYCNGAGFQGVLGVGLRYPDVTANRATTVTISAGGPPLTGVVEVVSGANSTCARTVTAVYCWGDGKDGRLGSGVFTDMLSPHQTLIIPPPSPSSSRTLWFPMMPLLR